MTSRKLLASMSALATVGLVVATGARAGVLLSEIDYDQPSTDNNEWVEFHNPDATAQALTGLDLVLVNGSNCTTYATYALDTLVIPPDGYVVIGNIACADPSVTLPASNAIQNGAPDGMYIQDRNTLVVLDSVEYESPGASVCGQDPTPATDDPNDPTGSIQRCGDVWIYSPNYTPCAPNDCSPVAVEPAS